jgi:hypothetical protein
MADDKVALEIFIEADKAEMTLGDLEAGFDSMKERLKNVGRGSEEFKQLSTAMAQTTAEIKNIELGFEGLDREQVASEMSSVAGGIGDITASLVLLGGENETIEQIGASIEKAMAISMGFKGAIEGLSSANKLYNNLLKQGKVAVIAKAAAEKAAAAGTWLLNAANKALNLTLKMNPIGLIVVAITAVVVVGAIVYFKDAIWGLIKTALEPFQFIIDLLIDGLQAMGIMASDEAIAQEEAAKKVVEAAKKRNEAAAEQRRVHKELTESMVADLDFEIRKRTIAGEDYAELSRKKIELLKEVAEEESKAAENNRMALEQSMKAMGSFGKFYEELYDETTETAKKAAADARKLSEDLTAHDLEQAQKRKEEREKASAEREKESEKRKAQREKDKAAEEKAAAEQKKIDEKAAADAIALEIEKNQLLEDLEAKAIEDKTTRSLAELEIAQERERQQLIEKYGLDTELLKALETEQLLQMNTLIADIEKEARENKATLDQEARDKELEADQKALDDKRAQRDKDFALATAAVGALSALNDAALATDLLNAAGNDEKQEEIRRASFERQKKLNIAMAAINGAQAVIAGFAQGGLPMAVLAGVTAAAQLAAIVATTYQSSASPTEVEETVPTPDGAGGGGGGVQLSPVTNTSTILGNQQVFVTETDITSTQNNVSVIEESATF